uniref:non-specific serine/threonine protein kinase n=1 Tax=Echinostoma caproni TaxID=27848 RepID=A0A183B935_9TREM
LCPANSRKCTIKIIDLEKCSTSAPLEEINREIKSMKIMKNENIVAYYASFVDATKLCIVMDLHQRGSRLAVIKYTQSKRNVSYGVFDETTIATILRDVWLELAYIHENGPVHRDLKCGNLLVKDDDIIQIADFGVTRFLATHVDLRRFSFVGTLCWMAPEVMQQARGYNQNYINYGQNFRKFTRVCLLKDPGQRLSALELLGHTYIKAKAKDREFLCLVLLGGKIPPSAMRVSKHADDGAERRDLKNNSTEWIFDTIGRASSQRGLDSEKDSDEMEYADGTGVSGGGWGLLPSATASAVVGGMTKAFISALNTTRNIKQKNELQDISFNYVPSKDSAEVLARKLVETNLLDGCDLLLVAHNVSKLISNPAARERIFPLNSPPAPGQVPVESELHGYAKLCLLLDK